MDGPLRSDTGSTDRIQVADAQPYRTSQKLIKACKNKREDEIVQILRTEEGQRAISIKDPDGWTLLHFAAAYNLPNAVGEILKLEEGKELNAGEERCGYTPMHIAAMYGYTQVVQVLLETEEGVKTVEEKDVNGKTPLHWAVYKNKAVTMELLQTDQGRGTVKEKDKHGWTALHYSCYYWFVHPQITKWLLQTKEGKDAVSLKTKEGRTPLILAILQLQRKKVRLLLDTEEGRETLGTMDDKEGSMPLHFACKGYCSATVVKMILEVDVGAATLLAKNAKGWTPLHVAAATYWDDNEILQLLLEREEGRRTIAERDYSNGHNPMHVAIDDLRFEPLKMMLETEEGKAAVGQRDRLGRTPLFIAVQNGFGWTLWQEEQGLIEQMAETLSIGDKDGNNPIHLLSRGLLLPSTEEVLVGFLKWPAGQRAMYMANNAGHTPRDIATDLRAVKILASAPSPTPFFPKSRGF